MNRETELLITTKKTGLSLNQKIIIGVLALIVLIAIGATVSGVLVTRSHNNKPVSKAKMNVIMMISDGWGPAAVTLARTFSKNKSLHFDPYAIGTIQTFSADSLVTDSAAGATAYSCGVHTYNGGIGVDANGKATGTILEAASRKGMRTGVVTTTRITDATPGAYIAHAAYRNLEDYIALQALDMVGIKKSVDVMLGGGGRYFYGRSDGINLVEEAQTKGYTVVQDAEGLAGVTEGKVLGLFADYNMAYAIDRMHNSTLNATQPSLYTMAQKALELLENENGFFVMLEGALIDIASHSNDAASMVHEALGYDATFQLALDYAKSHGNTVIISTSDHETGGLTLGMQSNYTPGFYPIYAYYPEKLEAFTASCDTMAARILAGEDIATVIASASNITDLTAAEIQTIQEFPRLNITNGMGAAIGRILGLRQLLAWTTTGHTGVDVNLYAYGLPNERPYFGNRENILLADLIIELLDLDVDSITAELVDFPTSPSTNGSLPTKREATFIDLHEHINHPL